VRYHSYKGAIPMARQHSYKGAIPMARQLTTSVQLLPALMPPIRQKLADSVPASAWNPSPR